MRKSTVHSFKGNLIRFLVFTMIMSLSLSAAVADMLITAEKVGTHEKQGSDFANFLKQSNALISREEGGYVLRDADWNQLSAKYDSFGTNAFDQRVIEVYKDGKMGAVSGEGKEMVPPQYFDIEYVSDRWTLGILAEIVDKDVEHEYTNGARITQADAYYQGTLVASLTRDEYKSAKAYGDYLYVSVRTPKDDMRGIAISPTGERRSVRYTHTQFEGQYSDIIHTATGEPAFVPTFSLDPDSIVPSIWRISDNKFSDVYGNIFEIDHVLDGSGGGEVSNKCGNGYLVVTAKDKRQGLYSFDGKEILPLEYDEIGGEYNGAYFKRGYQAVVKDGVVGYVDLQGNPVSGFTFRYSEGIKGFKYNNPFMWIADPLSGKQIIMSVGCTEMPKKYDEVVIMSNSKPESFVLGVGDNGLYGAIDIYGNEIIPLQYKKIAISPDGSVAACVSAEDSYTYDVYKITCADDQSEPPQPVETNPPVMPAADDEWTCPNCGTEGNTGKFCPNCAEPRPAKDWICPSCGQEGNTGNFCPNCAAPRP